MPGVTGRRAIGAIIGPCRCSDHSAYYNHAYASGFEYPDVLRAPREGRAAALLRNVMNSRRLIAAPKAKDRASYWLKLAHRKTNMSALGH
jgi:hypothetical protein